MGIWFRVIFFGLLAFGLAGCNLETKKPLFADADARLLLADYPNLAPYERNYGGWKKSTEPLVFSPEASHYLVKSGNSDMVAFLCAARRPVVDIAGRRSLGTSSYVLVMAEPKELLIHSLECKRLQELGKFEDEIEFKDSSCFIKDTADKMGLFKALTGIASEPSTKLVSEP